MSKNTKIEITENNDFQANNLSIKLKKSMITLFHSNGYENRSTFNLNVWFLNNISCLKKYLSKKDISPQVGSKPSDMQVNHNLITSLIEFISLPESVQKLICTESPEIENIKISYYNVQFNKEKSILQHQFLLLLEHMKENDLEFKLNISDFIKEFTEKILLSAEKMIKFESKDSKSRIESKISRINKAIADLKADNKEESNDTSDTFRISCINFTIKRLDFFSEGEYHFNFKSCVFDYEYNIIQDNHKVLSNKKIKIGKSSDKVNLIDSGLDIDKLFITCVPMDEIDNSQLTKYLNDNNNNINLKIRKNDNVKKKGSSSSLTYLSSDLDVASNHTKTIIPKKIQSAMDLNLNMKNYLIMTGNVRSSPLQPDQTENQAVPIAIVPEEKEKEKEKAKSKFGTASRPHQSLTNTKLISLEKNFALQMYNVNEDVNENIKTDDLEKTPKQVKPTQKYSLKINKTDFMNNPLQTNTNFNKKKSMHKRNHTHIVSDKEEEILKKACNRELDIFQNAKKIANSDISESDSYSPDAKRSNLRNNTVVMRKNSLFKMPRINTKPAFHHHEVIEFDPNELSGTNLWKFQLDVFKNGELIGIISETFIDFFLNYIEETTSFRVYEGGFYTDYLTSVNREFFVNDNQSEVSKSLSTMQILLGMEVVFSTKNRQNILERIKIILQNGLDDAIKSKLFLTKISNEVFPELNSLVPRFDDKQKEENKTQEDICCTNSCNPSCVIF